MIDNITVLEIGYVPNVPASFYFDGFYGEGEHYLNPWSMTLLQGDGKNILIDSGVDSDDPVKREIIKAAGVENLHHPREILATVGLTCEDIDAVILTHAHVDHASGVDCYPNAKFYLQRDELEGWIDIADKPKYLVTHMLSMDMSDLDRLQALYDSGRLVLFDGDMYEFFPGVSMMRAGCGHSFAPQMVLIDTAEGTFVHTGDVCTRPENLNGADFYIPNTKFAVGPVTNTLKDYDRILDWVDGDVSRVITTHDGSRRERYPDSLSPLGLGVYKIC